MYEQLLQVHRRSGYSGDEGPGFYVEDGVLYDRATDRDLAFWDFKPPLHRDAPFAWLHDLLHAHYPGTVPTRR